MKIDSIPKYSKETAVIGPTSFLEQAGGVLSFIILTSAIIISVLIRTPEKLQLEVAFASEPSAAPVPVFTDGQIDQIYVESGKSVTAGEVLGWIKSRTTPDDIQKLQQFVVANLDSRQFAAFEASNELFHDIRSVFEKYQTAARRLELLQSSRTVQGELAYLRQTLNQLSNLQSLSEQSLETAQKKLAMLTNDRDIRQELLDRGTGSRQNFLQAEQAVLDQHSHILSLKEQAARYRTDLLDTKRLIENKQTDRQQRIKEAILIAQTAAEDVLASVDAWIERYAIIAPIDGVFEAFGHWAEKRMISTENNSLMIVPNTQNYYAFGVFAGSGIGAAKVGDPVLLSLNDFPERRYGRLTGFVSRISSLAIDGEYQIEVTLPGVSEITADDRFVFTEAMIARAEILTARKSLLSRVVDYLI